MRKLPFFIFYALLALAIAGLGGYLVVAFMVENAPEVSVPAIEGLELTAALEVLTENELDLEVRGFSFSDEVAKNRVVRQRPAAGVIVKAGRGIGVILSRGPERHSMPNVVGRTLEDATILLTQAGLAPEVAIRIPGKEEGLVLAQAFEPGAPLESGIAIPLIASTAPEPKLMRMPNLQGLELHKAEAQLESLGVGVERVEEVRIGDPSRAGRILSQEPMPGSPIPQGTRVSLSVAERNISSSPGRMVLVEQLIPAGFTTREVEVVAQSVSGRRVILREMIPSGGALRELVELRPGERIRVFVDGKEK
ncbi:MAG: hypothetical protein C0609_09810 [Deltaproteobacteria bacterium]|nr:MAG: hypothetical protein C0609_09810 [Deltaproteobacteria bacterium]